MKRILLVIGIAVAVGGCGSSGSAQSDWNAVQEHWRACVANAAEANSYNACVKATNAERAAWRRKWQ